MQALMVLVRTEVHAFLSAYQYASTDKLLSPLFVEPTKLLKILGTLQEHVPPGLALPVPATLEHLHYYYKAIRVVPTFQTDHVYLHLHVPLVHNNRAFHLYKASSWPTKLNTSTSLFTYFEPEKQYLAVDVAAQNHMLLSAEDIKDCLADRGLHVCHPSVEVLSGQSSCLYALLTSNIEQVHQRCTPLYTLHPRPRFLSLRHGRDWVFSLPRPAKLAVTDMVGTPYVLPETVSTLPRTGILRLPAGAIATINGASLYAGSSFSSAAIEDTSLVLPDISSAEWIKHFTPVALTPEGQEEIKTALKDSENSIHLAGASLAKVNQIATNAETHLSVIERTLKTPWGISISTALVILTAIGLAVGFFFYFRSKFGWLCPRKQTPPPSRSPERPRPPKRPTTIYDAEEQLAMIPVPRFR